MNLYLYNGQYFVFFKTKSCNQKIVDQIITKIAIREKGHTYIAHLKLLLLSMESFDWQR